MPSESIDREVFLVCARQRPHVARLAHLESAHNVPATAGYIFRTIVSGEKDPDTRQILQAITAQCDSDGDSPTCGCMRWYMQGRAADDTNASFFVSLPLAVAFLAYGDRFDEQEKEALRAVFAAGVPWFRHMAQNPSFYYPNKCLGDVAMLLAAGHILKDETVIAEGRDFCRRYFDYTDRRGVGWGEDHSPVYLNVIVEMGLLIMLLEQKGELYDRARAMVDELMAWVVFNEGYDAVPTIRGYNFAAEQQVPWQVRLLLENAPPVEEPSPLSVLGETVGYRYTPRPLTVPRQWRRRVFDDSFSTSFIGPHSRLGTLSNHPVMPNTDSHDGWGKGWQTKPAAFIVHGHDYGVLQWCTEDDEGVVRQHEAGAEGYRDFASRHLFKRISFHPDVLLSAHQEGTAAIILREVHHLHSPTVRLEDRWRMVPGSARVLLDGMPWDGEPTDCPPGWLVLDYEHTAVALYPLACRGITPRVDDPAGQLRSYRNVQAPAPRIAYEGDRLMIGVPLIENISETVTEPLLFGGWCVVLLESAAEAANLRVTESFRDDGELPRHYGEQIRTVELHTPRTCIRLERDMLTRTERRFTDNEPVEGI